MNPTIRRVIQAEESGIDFREAVNTGKIVLVDIQKGEVGDTVSQLIGSIVITKVWAAAQSRVNQPVAERKPFYLFVDELQNFAGEGSNFTKILSEAREYRLGVWMATQYLRQLASEMRRAVSNNARAKIVFNPEGSDDTTQIARMLQGIDKDELMRLGKYRAAVQKPAEQTQRDAVTFDTYPPWNADRDGVDRIKEKAAAATGSAGTRVRQALGAGGNGGGDYHRELLEQAESRLENRGFQVDLVYQDAGEEKPDGRVHLPDGDVAHLEAEHSTLSKPSKVLKNLHRASLQDREVFFVVEEGKAAKLENIVCDPVNRRGSEHEDSKGSYSHYTDGDGNPFTVVGELTADHRIIEVGDQELEIHDEPVDDECPMLDQYSEDELTQFCPHREDDGFCTALETPCVLNESND